MLVSRPLIINDKLWGTIYELQHVGDIFPVHTHTDVDNHITALMFGSVMCMGHPKYEGKVLTAQPGGLIVSWVAGEPHGFEAITAGATLLNLIRNR